MLIDKIKKRPRAVFFFMIFLFSCSLGFSQLSNTQKTLRIRLWAPMDENPSSQIVPKDDEPYYATSINALKKTAPFLLSGMIYGWEYEYTPSDKTRNVEEYFSFVPIAEITENDGNITFTDPAFLEARVYCWLEYLRSEKMMAYLQRWNSVKYPKVLGFGESSNNDSVEAIKEAVKESAKNAIRTYAQKQTKNKPKEVSGKILLCSEDPSIKILKGKYTAYLDFFLYVDKIVQYSQY